MALKLLDSKITEEAALQDVSERRVRGVRLGGLLFCAGAVLSALGTLTLDTAPPLWVFAVMASGFLTGIAVIAIAWERLPSIWLQLLPALATLQITACVLGIGADGSAYSWLYLIVVVTVSYAFRNRALVAAHLGLVLGCLALPLADSAIATSDSVRNLVTSGPTLILTAVLVTYFRERLEAGKAAYQELSRLDPLTGVGNYRTFYERLRYEISRHQRHERRFAVMLLDLNGFKQVNETFGHLEGDRLLQQVGQVLANTVRDEDSVARQGGDEFSVLAPETTWGEVVSLAGRLRTALATVTVSDRVLTTSIGWAIYPENGETIEELLAHADAELRENKFHSSARQPERIAPMPADARVLPGSPAVHQARPARTAQAGRAGAH
jgi:diguanylate cyclase (GGDEF)-like protein